MHWRFNVVEQIYDNVNNNENCNWASRNMVWSNPILGLEINLFPKKINDFFAFSFLKSYLQSFSKYSLLHANPIENKAQQQKLPSSHNDLLITYFNLVLLGCCMASLTFRDILPVPSSSFKKNAWESYCCSEMWTQQMYGGSVNELLWGEGELCKRRAIWSKEDRHAVCATAASCDDAEERFSRSKLQPAYSSKPLLPRITPEFRCWEGKDVKKIRWILTSWRRRAPTQNHQLLIWISAKSWKLV